MALSFVAPSPAGPAVTVAHGASVPPVPAQSARRSASSQGTARGAAVMPLCAAGIAVASLRKGKRRPCHKGLENNSLQPKI